MIENFFTTEQVANILQVHPFTILKFIKQGKLNGVKLGRVYRIKESDVKNFLEGRMTSGSVSTTTQKSALESPSETTEPVVIQKIDAQPQHNPNNFKQTFEIKKNEGGEAPHYYII